MVLRNRNMDITALHENTGFGAGLGLEVGYNKSDIRVDEARIADEIEDTVNAASKLHEKEIAALLTTLNENIEDMEDGEYEVDDEDMESETDEAEGVVPEPVA